MCIESPDVFVALGAGHILGSKECEFQFQGNDQQNQIKGFHFEKLMLVRSQMELFTCLEKRCIWSSSYCG
jgi:hypothetical protein